MMYLPTFWIQFLQKDLVFSVSPARFVKRLRKRKNIFSTKWWVGKRNHGWNLGTQVYTIILYIIQGEHIKYCRAIALKLLIISKNSSDKNFSVWEGRHTGPSYFFIGRGSEATLLRRSLQTGRKFIWLLVFWSAFS